MTLAQKPAQTDTMEEQLQTIELVDQEALAKRLWDIQGEAVSTILEDPAKFFAQFGTELFAPRDEYEVTCMDERVRVSKLGRGRIALAGSGVLQNTSQMEYLYERARKAGINIVAVLRHEGCGAEGIAKSLGLGDDEIASKAPLLAEVTQSEFGGKSPMQELPGHVARGMLYIGSRQFNEDLIRDQYTALMISERYTPMALPEAVAGVTIAFGAHNYRNDFSDELPFPITVVGDPDSKYHRTDQLISSLRATISSDPRTEVLKRNRRIKINGFDAPRAGA